ncbi:SusC/RagA family TonB-linked outer membrane protein [Puteibacter caeruleilacunae]|nr:SusC/RagA family TonB-linked outer membrane protein [Puteibacter caeruleilacunae]
MKLTTLFFLVAIMSVSASSYSQNKKITLKLNNASIIEVFNEIERQSEYGFLFKSDQFDLNKKYNISKRDVAVSKILDVVLNDTPYTYTLIDNSIVITSKEAKTNATVKQVEKVSGTVTDEAGEPLPGVSVVVKGTTVGITTDFDGKYSLDLPADAKTLVFSFVGMKSEEVEIAGQSVINLVMAEDAIGLEEVVAIGYGVQKKVNLTGAVGQVDSEVIAAKPVTNVQELLQGKTPGLNITKGSGAPGSGASINIRGTSTIGNSSGVLVIVDGVPGNIYTVNPNDIESVSVLKDAASASIYGSRAANGVILITTKKGNRDKELQVAITSSYGITNPLHFIDFLGSEDFMKMYNIARQNEGNDPQYTDKDFQDLKDGKIPDNVWYKEVFKKNQAISNNHISLSGKTKKLGYNISGSYDSQSGALPGNDYTRYIFKPDLTFNLKEWLSVRGNVQYTETEIDEPQGGQGNITAATRISPVTPIYNEAGQPLGPGGTPGGNPIAVLEQGGSTNKKYKETLAIFTAEITPLKNWVIKPLYSVKNTDYLEHGYSRVITLYKEDGDVYSEGAMSNQSIVDKSNQTRTRLLQITSNYSYTLNEDHNFSILAGYSQEDNKYKGFEASRKNPAFAGIYVLDIAQDAKNNSGTAHHDALQSVFGRLTYDYKGKYLFDANVRSDGSSRFADGHRWGTFPSFSAGWNVHHEEFFKSLTKYISRFKIRGSWGELGDAMKIDRYETRNMLKFNAKSYAFDGSLVGGAWSDASFKEDISWETARMTNIGVELGAWDNRIDISVDYFNNEREDILYKAPVPSEYGLGAPTINALKMRNRGLEAMFAFKDKKGDFEYGFDFNFNYSKNKVLDLYGSGPWKSGTRYTDVGTQLSMLYGYESDGLFQSQEDIDNSATQVNVKPGNIKYKDQLTVDTNNDGVPDEADGVINGDDRVILTDKVPIRYGINLNLKYKDFDFAVNTYGKLRNYRYLQGYEGWAFYLTTNARPMHLDNWTEENKDASYPRITTNMKGNDREFSDFWLRKANYLKIQNVQLGYTFPNALNRTLGFDYARVYVSGQNLGIISNYDGFDPEGGNYPLARTFSLGVQLKF